ncbi:MAG: hypothetical protein IJ731_03450 [Eubacterium sp.]|nr:hypothetical protein [Eubacterium sp.]
MTRIISIIMAIIIMLAAGVNTEMITASAKTTTTTSASTKMKSSPKKNKKKNKKKKKSKKTKKKNKGKKKKQKHVHYMPKGNMGKWFNSKQELKEYASSVMEEYNRQYEEGEITWDEYVQRCPYGYEAWSCSCGKWTGNFKHH